MAVQAILDPCVAICSPSSFLVYTLQILTFIPISITIRFDGMASGRIPISIDIPICGFRFSISSIPIIGCEFRFVSNFDRRPPISDLSIRFNFALKLMPN